ncbi:MAG: acyltransferase family protein [Eubacterium sp.]|nr:acyltransferase family protein [Eubacterium sp.]
MHGEADSVKNRVEWIDIAKLLGMIAIYFGHLCEEGRARDFVFYFHVPLFFFLSGCMNTYDKEENFIRYTLKRAKRILIPFYCFAFISVIIKAVSERPGMSQIWDYILLILKGAVRNSFFAPALWFLTCLFVMEIIFKIIKCFNLKALLAVFPLICFILSEFVIKPRAVRKPRMFYNFDSALYYILFFAVGYLSYPLINRLFELNTAVKKKAFAGVYIITVLYSLAVFFRKYLIVIPGTVDKNVLIFTAVIRALIMGMAVIMTARLLSGIPHIAKLGRKTLMLCGNEWITKALIADIFMMFGFDINRLFNPLITLVYTIILIVLNAYIIIPAEEKLIEIIRKKPE